MKDIIQLERPNNNLQHKEAAEIRYTGSPNYRPQAIAGNRL
jgi:hypothetical protein